MKKYVVSLVIGMAILVAACKEIPPYIQYGSGQALLKDTCYVTNTLPTKQDLNVLIEDISGERCINCPDAAEIAHTLLDNNPDRVVVSTIHPTILKGFTTPHDKATQDFRTEEGNNIVTLLIGEPLGLPAGAINRTKFAGETAIATSEKNWAGHMTNLLSKKAKASLELNVAKDTANRMATATAKVVFQEKISDPVHLTVFETESHIFGPQTTRQGVKPDYEHNFILRKVITPYFGIVLYDEVTTVGSTCEKGYEIAIDSAWKYKNCSIVAVVNVHGSENREILQVQSVDLK